jgi:hypothetical protein
MFSNAELPGAETASQFIIIRTHSPHINYFLSYQVPSFALRLARYDLAAAAADDGSVWMAGGSTGTSASPVTDDVEVVTPRCMQPDMCLHATSTAFESLSMLHLHESAPSHSTGAARRARRPQLLRCILRRRFMRVPVECVGLRAKSFHWSYRCMRAIRRLCIRTYFHPNLHPSRILRRRRRIQLVHRCKLQSRCPPQLHLYSHPKRRLLAESHRIWQRFVEVWMRRTAARP